MIKKLQCKLYGNRSVYSAQEKLNLGLLYRLNKKSNRQLLIGKNHSIFGKFIPNGLKRTSCFHMSLFPKDQMNFCIVTKSVRNNLPCKKIARINKCSKPLSNSKSTLWEFTCKNDLNGCRSNIAYLGTYVDIKQIKSKKSKSIVWCVQLKHQTRSERPIN